MSKSKKQVRYFEAQTATLSNPVTLTSCCPSRASCLVAFGRPESAAAVRSAGARSAGAASAA